MKSLFCDFMIEIEMMSSSKRAQIHNALYFAHAAHSAMGQLRKYTGEPYIVHPVAVARLVLPHVGILGYEAVVAAVLHDVIEDTRKKTDDGGIVPGIGVADIGDLFGPVVAQLVDDLTDVSKPMDGNRAARVALDRAHTAGASMVAKSIKCADITDNAVSIYQHDLKFARRWGEEKRLLMPHLLGAEPSLYSRAALAVGYQA